MWMRYPAVQLKSIYMLLKCLCLMLPSCVPAVTVGLYTWQRPSISFVRHLYHTFHLQRTTYLLYNYLAKHWMIHNINITHISQMRKKYEKQQGTRFGSKQHGHCLRFCFLATAQPSVYFSLRKWSRWINTANTHVSGKNGRFLGRDEPQPCFSPSLPPFYGLLTCMKYALFIHV